VKLAPVITAVGNKSNNDSGLYNCRTIPKGAWIRAESGTSTSPPVPVEAQRALRPMVEANCSADMYRPRTTFPIGEVV
jgi:hypothetical protein